MAVSRRDDCSFYGLELFRECGTLLVLKCWFNPCLVLVYRAVSLPDASFMWLYLLIDSSDSCLKEVNLWPLETMLGFCLVWLGTVFCDGYL